MLIFVTVGSQKFQFNRLLEKIDNLKEKNLIKDDIYAQIGYSNYTPKNYSYTRFMTKEEFNEKIECSDLIITHGGTGVIINSLKKNKKLLVVPRLSKFKEHVDDHQIQIVEEFSKLNFIESCYEINELGSLIDKTKEKKYINFKSNTNKIIENINKYINE